MYLCNIFVWINVSFIYVSTYLRIYISTYLCIYVSMYLRIYVSMIDVCMSSCKCLYACIHSCMHACTYMRMYARMHVLHFYANVCTCNTCMLTFRINTTHYRLDMLCINLEHKSLQLVFVAVLDSCHTPNQDGSSE